MATEKPTLMSDLPDDGRNIAFWGSGVAGVCVPDNPGSSALKLVLSFRLSADELVNYEH